MDMPRLWFSSGREQFWLVPDDVLLPPGPLRVRNLQQGPREVDPDALTVWSATRDEAAAHIDEEIDQQLRRLGADFEPLHTLGLSLGLLLTQPGPSTEPVRVAAERLAHAIRHARLPDRPVDEALSALRARGAALAEAIRDDDSDFSRSVVDLEHRVAEAIPRVGAQLKGLAMLLGDVVAQRRDE